MLSASHEISSSMLGFLMLIAITVPVPRAITPRSSSDYRDIANRNSTMLRFSSPLRTRGSRGTGSFAVRLSRATCYCVARPRLIFLSSGQTIYLRTQLSNVRPIITPCNGQSDDFPFPPLGLITNPAHNGVIFLGSCGESHAWGIFILESNESSKAVLRRF